jgi:hypothetical protein
MLEYREKNKKEGPVQTPADAADLGTGKMEKYMAIAAQFGVNDMDIGDSRESDQTVDQEYQAYITAPLSPKTVDVLKFWEVCDLLIDIQYYLMGHHRLTERPPPLFLQWQWTICLSKRLPSLVNTSFR